MASPRLRTVLKVAAAGAGAAAGAYAALAAAAWYRYGRPAAAAAGEHDEWLDQFMPSYDVVERHHIAVSAPPDIVLTAAKTQDLLQSPVSRAIFRVRELVLGATPAQGPEARGLLDVVTSLGWGVLLEVPDREVVVGAVTKPWEANVVFRAIPAADFARFDEAGYVKIAWTLRVDPIDAERCIFRTETRAVATDRDARSRFRRYWTFVSPGVAMIRQLTLRPLKRAAEARATGSASSRSISATNAICS